MAYVNLDDGFPDHRNIACLSDAAFRLHVAAIAYCNRRLTDGVLDLEDVPRLVRRFRRAAVAELLAGGDDARWLEVVKDGVLVSYFVRDYLDHNPTRAVVLERRAKAKARKDDWNASRKEAQ